MFLSTVPMSARTPSTIGGLSKLVQVTRRCAVRRDGFSTKANEQPASSAHPTRPERQIIDSTSRPAQRTRYLYGRAFCLA